MIQLVTHISRGFNASARAPCTTKTTAGGYTACGGPRLS
jgi:hypothetical protein